MPCVRLLPYTTLFRSDKLKDKQTAAIKAIDEKIERMKEEMSGAFAKFGRWLLKAAKKFFSWTLEKFGLSLSTIENIRSEEHTSELQSLRHLVCRLLLE